MRSLKNVYESSNSCFYGFLKEDLTKLTAIIKQREDDIAYLKAIEKANLTCSIKCHRSLLTKFYLKVHQRKEMESPIFH